MGRDSFRGGKGTNVHGFVPVLYVLGKSIRKVASARSVAMGPAGAKAMRIKRKFLDSSQVMLLDDGFHIFVWHGKASASLQRVDAVHHAHMYLRTYKRPEGLPISIITEGQQIDKFNSAFYDAPPGCL